MCRPVTIFKALKKDPDWFISPLDNGHLAEYRVRKFKNLTKNGQFWKKSIFWYDFISFCNRSIYPIMLLFNQSMTCIQHKDARDSTGVAWLQVGAAASGCSTAATILSKKSRKMESQKMTIFWVKWGRLQVSWSSSLKSKWHLYT